MSGWVFDDLRWAHLLWVVLACAALGVYGIWQRRRGLRRFAAVRLLPRLAPTTGWLRPLARLALIVASLGLLVFALVGPRWGEETQQLVRRNIDVMILLDVSRSMLARDIAPNRLERAKLAIRDDLLPALGGDRIGLIAFAGVPSVVCPLTTDYGFFRLALADVNTNSAPRGGTLIGDAIRKAGELLKGGLDTHRLIVLITDGEDQESFPVEAAAGVWADQQIPIVALALGDPAHGARIPVAGDNKQESFLKYKDEEVWSKADFGDLQRIADVSRSGGGTFLAVGTRNFDLGAIYRSVAANIRFNEDSQAQRVRQPARFHPFAVASLLALLVHAGLRDGARQSGARSARKNGGAL